MSLGVQIRNIHLIVISGAWMLLYHAHRPVPHETACCGMALDRTRMLFACGEINGKLSRKGLVIYSCLTSLILAFFCELPSYVITVALAMRFARKLVVIMKFDM